MKSLASFVRFGADFSPSFVLPFPVTPQLDKLIKNTHPEPPS